MKFHTSHSAADTILDSFSTFMKGESAYEQQNFGY